MKLQRKLANCNWMDVEPDRIDEFVNRAVGFQCKIGNETTREQLIEHLANPRSQTDFMDGIRYDGNEWYQFIRDANAQNATPIKNTDMVLCDCGHTVNQVHTMNGNTGTLCFDCYTRQDN